MYLLFKSNYGNIVCISEYLLGRSHATSKKTSTSVLLYRNVNENVANQSYILCYGKMGDIALHWKYLLALFWPSVRDLLRTVKLMR